MDDTIRYLNTDLDLTSADDLTALAAAFEARGVPPLHVSQRTDGLWDARFETDEPHAEPEAAIATMLAVVESLAGSARRVGRLHATRVQHPLRLRVPAVGVRPRIVWLTTRPGRGRGRVTPDHALPASVGLAGARAGLTTRGGRPGARLALASGSRMAANPTPRRLDAHAALLARSATEDA